jgi:IMP dehydrogenase
MASKEAQVDWKGKYSSFEGVSSTVPFKGPAANILFDLEKGIRSGLSYSGARTITELQTRAEFIIQTSAGATESGTHITHRQW